MNKKIIISGITSLGLAIVPTAGVFALTEHTDTVNVTVPPSCEFTVASTGVGTAVTIQNGQSKQDIPGSVFTISCNDTKGWALKAVGGTSSAANTTLTGGSGPAIATGTTFDGSVSNWAMKVSGTGAASGFTSFAKVPSTATTVASSAAATSGTKITATYGVGISHTQGSGTYTGKVTYTLVHPASS